MFDFVSYSEFSISVQNLKAQENHITVYAQRKEDKAFNIFAFQGQNSTAVHTKPT